MRTFRFAFGLLAVLICTTFSLTYAQELPRFDVTVLVNRDEVNVRIAPALGAEVVAFVDAGFTAQATGRSADGQWLRIDFNGSEAWIGLAVLTVLNGDINVLPVADPRSIPYGGFESPRSGPSSATSTITGRLADSGLRLRAGPGTAYPVLANPPRYTVFTLHGRTRDNQWLQVNFEGTLGWLVTGWVEIQNGASIVSLPIDGIVADSAPASGEGTENYVATLRLMLDRVNIAQGSVDSIRGTWTTVALGDRAACQNFPARPSDINIPNPLLAAFFPTLDPLNRDFNTAMANVRQAIDLWIESCREPQPADGVVGRAVVQGALNILQTVDTQFTDLRRRISELLPPERAVGANECLFEFGEQFDILRVIGLGELIQGNFTRRDRSIGFCVDVPQGALLRVEVLRIVGGSFRPVIAISPFNNPTQFVAVGRGIEEQNLTTAGPILITNPGRYLIAFADESEIADNVQYALIATNLQGLTIFGPGLGFDDQGRVVVNPVSAVAPTITSAPVNTAVCPSLAFTCPQLRCSEAQACLALGNFALDANQDGIACNEGVACLNIP